ncbi:MAG: response regulator [Bacteroidales bacterium]|nr:response regulator [Bacteroidales bacterium]MCF8332579.1 response regulator [Bacteroidales bacterium]
MLKTLIVDDEPDAIKSLSLICEEYCKDQVKIVGSAYIIEEAYKLIKEQNPDVLMLDIDLPRGNAFDLLDRFPKRNFFVILVSAYFDLYEKKMRKYDIHACVDKPVDIDEITSLMQMLYRKRYGD